MNPHDIRACTVKNKFDVLSCLEIMKYVQYPIHLHPSSEQHICPLALDKTPSLHSLCNLSEETIVEEVSPTSSLCK